MLRRLKVQGPPSMARQSMQQIIQGMILCAQFQRSALSQGTLFCTRKGSLIPKTVLITSLSLYGQPEMRDCIQSQGDDTGLFSLCCWLKPMLMLLFRP